MMRPEENQADYVSVMYNEQDRPFTQYPDSLTSYLVTRYGLSKGNMILDMGCGRGEFLRGFIRCGLNGYGIDRSLAARSICPEAEVVKSDLENEPLPYKDGAFDVVFSKSVLEHFYYPERLVREIYRILKPGGLAITLVPDWECHYKIFYADHTHRSPFALSSLRDILVTNGFDEVRVEKFRQLPFLWSMPWLQPFCQLVALLTPRSLSAHSKLVKFSKEVMLLSSAVKPHE